MIRNTRQREAIREVFETCGRPLAPEEALAAAQETIEGLGIATIYRNIKILVEEGWLVAVELPGQAARYELAGKDHHHHFHCEDCGCVFELKACEEDFRRMAPKGFQVTGHEVLLFGNCRSCRRKSDSKDRLGH